MGGPGCGKTAVCCELVWPTSTSGRQASLGKHILAYHFCQAHDIETLSIANFIHSVVDQILKSPLVTGYQELLDDPAVHDCLDAERCENNPDAAFKNGILVPLSAISPPAQNVFIIVDSIDESCLVSEHSSPAASSTIAELLARHHMLFPRWLMLVCSARKQSKSITRLFTGFRKISLDDLRKPHVVRDVQQYILSRLDKEDRLRQHLSRETAETLNQLHIKCNGCFLYLEKVLDGVVDNFILLREIREIPGTLNGLYLWLCQRLFVGRQFIRVQPILNVILAARRPLTEMELYSCAFTRDAVLALPEFRQRLDILSKILIEGRDGTKILFHHSFAEWLLDVKHCTQKYLCATAEGHGMLAMSFTVHAPSLTAFEVQDFALHLAKCGLPSPFQPCHAALWLLTSGADVGDCFSAGVPKDQAVLKLLLAAGARLPIDDLGHAIDEKRNVWSTTDDDEDDELHRLFERGTDHDESDRDGRPGLSDGAFHSVKHGPVDVVLSQEDGLCMADKAAALSLAARQGDVVAVAALIRAGASVNHSENDGWTVLRSAAWGGHTAIVQLLLEAGAEVRSMKRVAWLETETKEAWKGPTSIACFILKPKNG